MVIHLSSLKSNFVNVVRSSRVKSESISSPSSISCAFPSNSTGLGASAKIGHRIGFIENPTFASIVNLASNCVPGMYLIKVTREGILHGIPSCFTSSRVHTASFAMGNPLSEPCMPAIPLISYFFLSALWKSQRSTVIGMPGVAIEALELVPLHVSEQIP